MKKKNTTKVSKKVFFGLLIVVLFFLSMYSVRCGFHKVCEVPMIEKWIRHDATILMPKGALTVEVVNTKASRELGLSFREKMGRDEGMLFVFDHPGRYGFWMKDMKFSLDIVWINQNGVVVWVERNVTQESYPSVFMNQADASYVLEMSAGLSEEFGVYLGTKVKITE